MQLAQFDVAGKMFSMVIATIQIHATRVAFNWEIQMLILKFGFQILQSNTKSGNGFHLWEICPQGGFVGMKIYLLYAPKSDCLITMYTRLLLRFSQTCEL